MLRIANIAPSWTGVRRQALLAPGRSRSSCLPVTLDSLLPWLLGPVASLQVSTPGADAEQRTRPGPRSGMNPPAALHAGTGCPGLERSACARGFTAIQGPASLPASLYDGQLWGEPNWGLLVPIRESFFLDAP